MISIEDIRNSKRNSGFDHVQTSQPSVGPRPFFAVAGTKPHFKGEKTSYWRGTRRATAEEAAEDYCDYINGQPGAQASKLLRSAGHNGKRIKLSDDPEVALALGILRDARGKRAGNQGYVYCIAEAEGLHPLVKIGYSTNPEARVGELQTGNGRKLFLLAYFAGTIDDERALHAEFIEDNTLQEWFRPSNELLSQFGYDVYDLYAKGTAALR